MTNKKNVSEEKKIGKKQKNMNSYKEKASQGKIKESGKKNIKNTETQNKEKQNKEKQNKEKQNKEKQNKDKQNQSKQKFNKQGSNKANRPNQYKLEIRKNRGNRPESPCPVSYKCGSCQLIRMPYEDQLKQKQEWVGELLKPFCTIEPIIGMENPLHYRHKVHAVFGEDYRHNIISGMYEQGTHDIVPVDACLIEQEKASEIIVSIRNLAKSFKIRPYNEDSGYGLLRHVVVRVGYVTGEIMVVLVLASPIMPSKNNFAKALLKIHPEISTIVVNVNPRGTSVVLGDKEQVIYGKGYIEDVLCGKRFRISPKSFYQVNPVQTEKLYKKAIEYAQFSGEETVLDAYCGTGTIGLIASDSVKEVIGVEVNKAAVADARINAKINQVKNIKFYQYDAGKFMVEMAEQKAKVDVVLMDPPRAGSDEAFLTSVVKLAPDKIVYISCNPETLARDLKFLKDKKYQVKKGICCDMFAFTKGVEVVCLLEKKTGI
ncbi:23S rRNA (uracil(1939)-C(5))-methyltransferase RlmD [Lachnospiraceae bacterium OttesenSCG-928-D06]|nr:23S rRNA (uracil(1939)-C(5))-methyltransferase RlmD [Lachnospiraceae bacterium OttesenSCG-928-D06]